jgi:hypothetical protein
METGRAILDSWSLPPSRVDLGKRSTTVYVDNLISSAVILGGLGIVKAVLRAVQLQREYTSMLQYRHAE